MYDLYIASDTNLIISRDNFSSILLLILVARVDVTLFAR